MQYTVPAGQFTQTPTSHDWPDAHARPQLPQLRTSRWSSTHTLPQAVAGPEHVGVPPPSTGVPPPSMGVPPPSGIIIVVVEQRPLEQV